MSGQLTVVGAVEPDDNESDYGYNDDNGTDHGNDGNESDYGYNDENMSDDNGIPVFYLSSANLDDLELVGDGYSEGNYIVDEREVDYLNNGSTLQEFWLEPVEEIDGEWSLTEEEDDIQTNYYGFEYIEDYFGQNSIEPVGYLYEQYDDNGTDHGYDDNGSDYGYNDDNGTDHGNDGNESDYGYNDENMFDDNGIPVFYLSSVNLDDLDLVGDGYSEGNYIVDEREVDYLNNGSTLQEFWLEPVEEIDGEWSLTEEEDDISDQLLRI